MDVLSYVRPVIFRYWKLKNAIKAIFGYKDRQIVICGYPRSGTSLLYNMISANIDNFICEEFEIQASRRLHRSGNYVTKYPLDVLDLDEIYEKNILNKDIFVIIVTRDIRDVITSRHPNLPDQYFIGFKHSWWPQNKEFTEWKYDAPGIEAIYQAIKKSRAMQDGNVIEVRYEDIVSDPDNVQSMLEKFLHVKFAGKFSEFHKMRKRHAYNYAGRYQAKDETLVRENKEVDLSRLAKWRRAEYRDILVDQFTKYPKLLEILIDEGYETDKSWFNRFLNQEKV